MSEYSNEFEGFWAILGLIKMIVVFGLFCWFFSGANDAYKLMEQPYKDFAWYVMAILILLYITK